MVCDCVCACGKREEGWEQCVCMCACEHLCVGTASECTHTCLDVSGNIVCGCTCIYIYSAHVVRNCVVTCTMSK